MLDAWIDTLPAWLPRLFWTIVVVSAAWVAGRALAVLVTARVNPGPTRATETWLGGVRLMLRRRLPFWATLIGLWVASGSWAMTPEARLFLARALFVVGAASVTLAVAKLMSGFVDTYGARFTPGLPVTSLTRNIAWSMVVVVGTLMILNGIGVSITPMLTALGVGGLAVALALQEPLSNFFAGFFLSVSGQIRVGDCITVDGGDAGYVADFSWRATRIRMLSNNVVVVPNARLAKAVVVNHHLPDADMAVLVEGRVGYTTDLAHVERVVSEVGQEVMQTVPGGVPSFAPFVRFHTFGESSINFTAILRAEEFVGQYLVKHEFIKRLHTRFRDEGLVTPFPARTLYHAAGASLAETPSVHP